MNFWQKLKLWFAIKALSEYTCCVECGTAMAWKNSFTSMPDCQTGPLCISCLRKRGGVMVYRQRCQ